MHRLARIVALSAFAMPAMAQAAAPIFQPEVAQQQAVASEAAPFALLDAALIASDEHDPREREAHRARWNELVSDLRRDTARRSPREQAAAVLARLHGDVLTGPFDPGCGSVALTLEKGRYNCVTATLLFVQLARAMDLPVTILHGPEHVRLRLETRPPLEFEPTCAEWFDRPGARLVVWKGPPREISATALVGKLYYNQGVAALERRDFHAAISALEHSLRLDPLDSQAKQNLLAALNNGALARCEQRQFTAADKLLTAAQAIDAAYPPLATNRLHVYGKWTIALCETSQHHKAIALLERAAIQHPRAELVRAGRAAVYRLWAEDLLKRGEQHAALARIEEGLALSPGDAQLLKLHRQLH